MKKSSIGSKLTVFVLCTMLSVIIVPAAWAAEEQPVPITVFIDGEQIQFSVDPIIESGKTLVPMRAIFEALGATLTWDSATKTATAVKDNNTIMITIDSPKMIKNDAEITLDVPAKLVNGSTLVPARAVSEGLGAGVEWNGELRQVLITTDASVAADETMRTEEMMEKFLKALQDGYPYTQLSDSDMQALKESYYEIRYAFEQMSFPYAVLFDNAEIVKEINLKSDKAKNFAKDVWNGVVIERILYLQVESEDAYITNLNEIESEEMYIKSFQPLIKESGLEAGGYFDVSFETLADKSVMMLLTFKDTDGYLACKYIGVVVKADKSVRYFTAESDLLDPDNLYFCEITATDRGTWDTMGFDKSDFIEAVNMALAGI